MQEVVNPHKIEGPHITSAELDGQPRKSVFKQELFKGRLNRTNYILGFLLYAASVALAVYLIMIISAPFIEPKKTNPTPLEILITVLLFIPFQALFALGYFSLITRRVHDLDEEKVDGSNWARTLYLKPGTPGPNKYGEPQKGTGLLQVLGFK